MKTQTPNQQHAARGKEREQQKLFARDVMSTDVSFVEPDASVREVARKLADLDVGALPVCASGRLVGMITDRDLVVRMVAENQPNRAPVSEAMSEDVVWAYEDDDLNTIVKLMKDEEVRRVPILNHDERLVGIVALSDLARSDAPKELKLQGVQAVS